MPSGPLYYLYLLILLLGHVRHPLQHLLGLVILGRVLAPPEPHLAGQRVLGAAPWGHGDGVRDSHATLWTTAPFPAPPRFVPRQGLCAPVTTHAPAAAAATVAGEAPARRSWFCREKSMLYHSDERSAGFGGITRLGFSRTSRICKEGTETSVKHMLTGTFESVAWHGDHQERSRLQRGDVEGAPNPRPAWAEPCGRLQVLALSSPALTSSSPPYSPGIPQSCWGCGGASPRHRGTGCPPPHPSGSGWPPAESPGGSCSAPTSSAWSTCGTVMVVTGQPRVTCDHL